MQIQEYVALAERTENKDFVGIAHRIVGSPSIEVTDADMIQVLHALLGLANEVGEATTPVKANIFYGKSIDWMNLGEEMGDMMWYLSMLSRVIHKKTGLTLEQWMERNIEKLRARFPGKFAEQNAINRDLEAERKALEGK
jgi:NTP pyrophosphatase (non-canonical NTP hydrolase)